MFVPCRKCIDAVLGRLSFDFYFFFRFFCPQEQQVLSSCCRFPNAGLLVRKPRARLSGTL